MEEQSEIIYYQTKNPQGPRIELLIAPDEMSAEIRIYPGGSKTVILEYAEVIDLLTSNGINFGIKDELIAETVLEFNNSHKPVCFIAAEGEKPKPAIAEHIELNTEVFEINKTNDNTAAKIDWKEIKTYTIVDKDTILATLVPSIVGINGKTITGKDIPFPVLPMPDFKPGRNVVREDMNFKASVTGKLVFANNTFAVEEVFIVKGDVDYHTGNIIFPGDVIVEGNICQGFSVQSSKSIIVKGSIDGQYVTCTGNLICEQGIIGHGDCYCKVGGNCSAKFIEHMNIAIRGILKVDSAILSSKVYCLDTIIMGEQGKIVGGEIWATKGITCAYLGNKVGTSSSIIIGINFINDQKLKTAVANLQKYSMELQYIKKQEQTKETIEKAQKLQTIVDNYLSLITKLSDTIDVADTAEITVTQTVYPATSIRICRVQFLVTKEQKSVVYFLDKNKGIIQTKPLKLNKQL